MSLCPDHQALPFQEVPAELGSCLSKRAGLQYMVECSRPARLDVHAARQARHTGDLRSCINDRCALVAILDADRFCFHFAATSLIAGIVGRDTGLVAGLHVPRALLLTEVSVERTVNRRHALHADFVIVFGALQAGRIFSTGGVFLAGAADLLAGLAARNTSCALCGRRRDIGRVGAVLWSARASSEPGKYNDGDGL